MEWIDVNERLPELNEEYLASIDLQDEYDDLVCFAVEFNRDTKKWFWSNTEEEVQGIVMFWKEKPKPHPYKIPKKAKEQIIRTIDQMERLAYGQCVHGENLAVCDICNVN